MLWRSTICRISRLWTSHLKKAGVILTVIQLIGLRKKAKNERQELPRGFGLRAIIQVIQLKEQTEVDPGSEPGTTA